MVEKDMVLDVLSTVKANINLYSLSIIECNDLCLRRTLQQLREEEEEFQFNLYKIASELEYYKVPPIATEEEVTKAKAFITQSQTAQQGAGPNNL